MDVDTIKKNGSNRDVDTTAEQLYDYSEPLQKGVILKAGPNNSGTVYVGKSGVTADSDGDNDGLPLEAGESIFLEIKDLSTVYVIASANNQKVFFIAI